MPNKGVKVRTSQNSNTLEFTVKQGYTFTSFLLNAVANDDGSIIATKVTIDDDATNLLSGNVTFTKSTNAKISLTGISANNKVVITFDNTNVVKNKQLNAYYEIGWEEKASDVPTSTTVTPSSATVYVGYTTTLTGSFTGGDFTGEWVSDNEDVATVSSTGVVTGVAAGTANITYQWTEDQSEAAYKATAAITVTQPDPVGTASSLALDIAQYETINLTDAYSYNSDTRTLVVSANQIRANGSTQKWMTFKDASGAQKTWDATGVFKGSAFYNTGSSSNAVVLLSGRTYTLAVTNCEQISALVLSGGSSKTSITIQMDIYEMDAYGIAKASETPVATKSTTSTSEATITASGLDKSKVYQAVFTSTHASSNSYVYEVAFVAPDPRTATTLSFPEAAYEVTLGETFTAPTLTKSPADLEGVAFSSSNTAVATVDATTGEVTIKAGGVTTITAAFEATDDYIGSSASYVLTVTDPSATGYDSEGVTITWPFSTGAAGQTATIAYNSAEEELFKGSNVSIGSSLSYNETNTATLDDVSVTETKLRTPKTAESSASDANAVTFTVTPKTGITFTPTKVSFVATRCGTNGGKMTMTWVDSENADVALGTASAASGNTDPARNNETPNATKYEYDLTSKGAKATTGECGIKINIYNVADKDYALANIIIEGTLSGSVSAVATYTITAQVGTSGAGSVNPMEVVVDEGEGATLTATANTGYLFQNWTKASDAAWTSTANPLALTNVIADETYTANYKQLYAINYDTTGEGVLKGTTTNILGTEYASAADKFTAPSNLYLTKEGSTFQNWTDGTNSYTPGTEYTLTGDITLSPVFAENTQSLTESMAATTVTWNFGSANVAFNCEGKTQYYVQQATVNGAKIDVPMFCDATSGKLNNVGRTDDLVQANGGTKLTIPAVSGMTIVATAYNKFETTKIAGSTDYEATTASPWKATYTYTGTDAAIDIEIDSEIKYLSSVAVTYPQVYTFVDVTSVGYRTFASSKALDFSKGVEGLTAYSASVSDKTVSFNKIETAVPASTGMLIKAAEGRYYIPLAVGTPAEINNALVGVTAATDVAAGSFVLMNGAKGVGFYKTTADKFTVGANTAYLPASVAGARTFIGFEESTGVESVAVAQQQSSQIFDLQGRRIESSIFNVQSSMLKKGLYIVNGKKMLVK